MNIFILATSEDGSVGTPIATYSTLDKAREAAAVYMADHIYSYATWQEVTPNHWACGIEHLTIQPSEVQ